ncbi:MAG: DUF5110 domain-containing protein [Bacteroidales bacterium]|nr:DUF5110 domain-containing protein [Bacteroidales bacterium]
MTLKTVLLSTAVAAVSLMGLSLDADAQNKIGIVAHRGFWKTEEAGFAQNSIKALELAQTYGFWGSEFDVQLTSDDVPIVNHDNEIDGLLIWDNPYSKFKEHRLKNGEIHPTLDDYLRAGEKCETTMLVFELKPQKDTLRDERLLQLSIDALKKHGLYDPERVMFISFSHYTCRRIGELAPEFTNQFLGSKYSPDALLNDGINGVDFNESVFDIHPDWLAQAHKNCMSVNVWTVNQENVMNKFIDLGVDAITTNEPLLLRSLLGIREHKFYEPVAYDPKARDEAVVVAGKARFTVLTSRLIRMEWAEDGKFEDRASLAIVNRNLDVPKFTVKKTKGSVVIKTDDVVLTYKGQEEFNEKNLSVCFKMSAPGEKKPAKVTWAPGADDSANLLGTTRTLDGCDGEKTREPYDKGVISRDGWAILDESDRQVFQPVDSDWKNWIALRSETPRKDLYIFAYGHDYKAAISDFTKVAGKIPLPPKYVFGYWWCRYWQYSDFEFVDLAKEIRSLSIPADVMVLDMDWHETWGLTHRNAKNDASGERKGWTGYTWQNQLFPDPEGTLAELHNLNYRTTLNLHPASGIQPFEEPYDRFVKDYLSRTSDYDGPKDYINEDGSKAYVPYRQTQEAWADAYFNSVIRPLEAQGVDFWWLDWQQWKFSKYMKGVNNTFWLNHTFFNDKVRQSVGDGMYAKRPVIYHRWGGIGSHRYQIGFSGDTYASWKVLGYLPYFTSTASNVGYGYWGHDIGGHMQPRGVNTTDPELYTRWIQAGVFTPIYKTHSTKDRSMEKRMWMFPEYFDAMRAAIRLRYDLSPYIYTAARQAYDTGISMCRPLYYDQPEAEQSYTYKQEYMFGDDILAATINSPVDKADGLAPLKVWLPEGCKWYDVATGKIYEGGAEYNLKYTVDENPYFVKAGAIIPMADPEITSLQQRTDAFRVFVAPGAGESSAVMYEDDGETQAYSEENAVTRISKSASAEKVCVKVEAREGNFAGASDTRNVTFVLEHFYAPETVLVNGEEVPYSRHAEVDAKAGKKVWGYVGKDLQVVVYTQETSVKEALQLECRFDPSNDQSLLDGKKGMMNRMMKITPETKLIFAKHIDPWVMLPDPFLALAQASSFILAKPENTEQILKNINVEAMEESFNAIGVPAEFTAKCKAQCE